jgi:hypothetical protein
MELEEALRILSAFEREHVEYVLVGSMGMAVLGVIRATRDIDVFVAPDEDNVARLRRALASVFDDPSIDESRPPISRVTIRRSSTHRRPAISRSICSLASANGFASTRSNGRR